MERPTLRMAMIPIVALALACSVIAQAEEFGTGRGMKTDIKSESEYLKLEQAKPHFKSLEEGASLVIPVLALDSVKNLAEFEISNLQMVSGEGQLLEVSYSAISAVIPESYYLSENYTNPFNPETKISFHLPGTARVELLDYNLLGQRVNILVEGVLSSGEHLVSCDSRDDQGNSQPSGVYFYRIESERGSLKRKMALVM